jgi:hypothetical protein
VLEKKNSGQETQRIALRDAVGRVIVRRDSERSVIFSPDGPLDAMELDLVESDTFIPALAGFLPPRTVAARDEWPATAEAASELTGIGPIQSGGLRCMLLETRSSADQAVAKLSVSGTVVGPSDLGPTRDKIDGYLLFDLDENLITYVLINATRELFGPGGKVVGRLEGRYELQRRLAIDDPTLSDRALPAATLKPTAESTALLFDAKDLGVRILYPRNWELVSADKNLVGFREPTGGHMRVTVDSSPAPSVEKLRGELLEWLGAQKARVQNAEPPQSVRLSDARNAQRFTVHAVLAGKPDKAFEWNYLLVRSGSRYATVAGSLQAERSDALRGDVEYVARQIQFQPEQ